MSESTITQHEEEVMGMELITKSGIPCVVQWCMLVVFSTYKVELNIGKTRFKNQKNHEAVNMAITDASSRPFWRGAHTQIVHVGISGKGPYTKTHRKWGVTKEMEGWMMRVES